MGPTRSAELIGGSLWDRAVARPRSVWRRQQHLDSVGHVRGEGIQKNGCPETHANILPVHAGGVPSATDQGLGLEIGVPRKRGAVSSGNRTS